MASPHTMVTAPLHCTRPAAPTSFPTPPLPRSPPSVQPMHPLPHPARASPLPPPHLPAVTHADIRCHARRAVHQREALPLTAVRRTHEEVALRWSAIP